MTSPIFVFHPLTERDFPLLQDWINRPHVAEWWDDDPDLEEIEEEYTPYLLPDSMVRVYIAHLDDEPIGYIQEYTAMGAGDGWWEDETDPGVRGIDLFLANSDQLGQGLGTEMIRQFVQKLFEDEAVTIIQIDPSPDNKRAISAYRNVGFQDKGIITTPDGLAHFMRICREQVIEID